MNPLVASLTSQLTIMRLICFDLEARIEELEGAIKESGIEELRDDLIEAQKRSDSSDWLLNIINNHFGMCRISKPCQKCPTPGEHWVHQSEYDEEEPLHPSLFCPLHDGEGGILCTCTDHCEHCTCVVVVPSGTVVTTVALPQIILSPA